VATLTAPPCLLPQPHGLEGFVLLAVLPDLDDLAVPQTGDNRFAHLDGRGRAAKRSGRLETRRYMGGLLPHRGRSTAYPSWLRGY